MYSKRINKSLLYLLFVIVCNQIAIGQSEEDLWVDSVFQELDIDKKIGQLLMIRAHSDLGDDHVNSVKKLIKDYHVGSLVFFQGTVEKQVQLTNQYQSLSEVPMLIAMDAEWGPGMRLKDGMNYPRQLMMGAIQNNRLIYQQGREIADQLSTMGVHINFAPVADINNNPDNPVIGNRSFGEDRYNVTAKSYQYVQGLQDGGIIACAKHFPGHGDTDTDSHISLPVIRHSMSRLDSLELYPFKALISQGVKSIMVAHLHIPAIDDRPNMPSSLSGPTNQMLLRDSLGFEGLIITDGMEMQGVTNHFPAGEAEARALAAGADLICLPVNVPAVLKSVKEYISKGLISAEDLDEKVKRVLHSKYNFGLSEKRVISEENVDKIVMDPDYQATNERLIENAITVLSNKNQTIPISSLEGLTGCLAIGASGKVPFHERIQSYNELVARSISKNNSFIVDGDLMKLMSAQPVVIASFHDMSSRASRKFGVPEKAVNFLKELQKKTKVIVVLFGSPYAAEYFDGFDHVIVAYNEWELTQDLCAQGIFGVFGFRGLLPVSASASFPVHTGVITQPLNRLGFSSPERTGMITDSLKTMEVLIDKMIRTKAAPGCQVLVAKDSRIVWQKAYGYHTYRKKKPVSNEDIYDLASLTKILATTVSMIHLTDRGWVDINRPVKQYVPKSRGTNKENMVLADIMSHVAGLKPWIPFYKFTLSESKKYPRPLKKYYQPEKKSPFDIPVAEKMFMNKVLLDTIDARLYDSELRSSKNYRYSDLGFYMLDDLINEVSGNTLPQYVSQNFYQKLGLKKMGFNPWIWYNVHNIPPTEEDSYFRRKRIQGYVHDMGAAMKGGVSGHAGLFSNSYEVAIMLQMLLNEGNYGGEKYFQPSTLESFTTRHYRSTRRGLGFDMKQLDSTKTPNMALSASDSTFGHLGFTGIAAWADPEHNLIYIFISNRTYPNMKNNALNANNYRSDLHEIVYKSIR